MLKPYTLIKVNENLGAAIVMKEAWSDNRNCCLWNHPTEIDSKSIAWFGV